MVYYPYQKTPKIPALLGILLVGLFIFVLNYFIPKSNVLNTKATEDYSLLLDYKITNITNTSAAVFFRSKNQEVATLFYSKDKFNFKEMIYDDRDVKENQTKYYNHYFTLKDLDENSSYYFYFLIGNKIVKNKDDFFILKTKSKINLVSNLKPAFGKVLGKNNLPLINGVVFMKIAGADYFSTLTKDTGEWIIPLYYLTKEGTSDIFYPALNNKIDIKIIDDNGSESNIKTEFSKINPVSETVIIGRDFNFINKSQVLGESVEATPSVVETKSSTSEAKTNIVQDNPVEEFRFNIPLEDAILDTKKPLFKGHSKENIKLTYSIFSIVNNIEKESQVYENYANKEGEWSYSPFFSLNPGLYKIVVSYTDNNKKIISISRKFYIAKSGETVLGEATPEAIISLSPTPTKIVAKPTIQELGNNMVPFSIASLALMIIGLGFILLY